jgi:hypothetical protein
MRRSRLTATVRYDLEDAPVVRAVADALIIPNGFGLIALVASASSRRGGSATIGTGRGHSWTPHAAAGATMVQRLR